MTHQKSLPVRDYGDGKFRKIFGDPYYCKNGHPKSERQISGGRVRCKACARMHKRNHRDRTPAEQRNPERRRDHLLELDPSTFSPELLQRFWKDVDKQDDGHWMWTGVKSNAWKYGIFRVELGNRLRQFQAHRIAKHLAEPDYNGARLVKKLSVCNDILCINPDHWELEDQRTILSPEETPEEVKANRDPIRPCWGCLRPTRDKDAHAEDAPGTVVRDGNYCSACRTRKHYQHVELKTLEVISERQEKEHEHNVTALQKYMERRRQRLAKPNHIIHKLNLPPNEKEA